MLSLLHKMLSPYASMRLSAPYEPSLVVEKLHSVLTHILNSGNQFETWSEHQQNNSLHSTLQQIYDEFAGREQQQFVRAVGEIYQFYTMLLCNSKDELLVCKLVSDQFVIRLCQDPTSADLEPYRINMIRTYLSSIGTETIKYMVIDDKFAVCYISVAIWVRELGSGSLEATTMGSCLLNVLKRAEGWLWGSLWVARGLQMVLSEGWGYVLEWLRRGEQGDRLGLQSALDSQRTSAQTEEVNSGSQGRAVASHRYPPTATSVHQLLIFLLELITCVPLAYKEELATYSYIYLDEILEVISTIADPGAKLERWVAIWGVAIEYGMEEQLVARIELKEIIKGLNPGKEPHELTEVEGRAAFVLCGLVCSKYTLLSERAPQLQPEPARELVETRTFVLKSLLASLVPHGPRTLNMEFLKPILLSLFHLKLVLPQLPRLISDQLDRTILKLFLAYLDQFSFVLHQTELWSSIIKWYEDGITHVSENLLTVPTSHHQLADQTSASTPYNLMLSYEYVKNYRFMIVGQTFLDKKAIKQERSYYSTFTSPGLALEPGKTARLEGFRLVCEAVFHYNSVRAIQVAVIEDKECFLLAMKTPNSSESLEYKIMVNIKFKHIEGFTYCSSLVGESKSNSEPKYIKIDLKGSQQIIMEFANPKVTGSTFKEYLIRSRDLTRQRQLSFISGWVKEYRQDTERVLAELSSQEIQENV